MTENFRRISLESAPRTELHDALGLTGCEVSVNALPAGAAVPFVHASLSACVCGRPSSSSVFRSRRLHRQFPEYAFSYPSLKFPSVV